MSPKRGATEVDRRTDHEGGHIHVREVGVTPKRTRNEDVLIRANSTQEAGGDEREASESPHPAVDPLK